MKKLFILFAFIATLSVACEETPEPAATPAIEFTSDSTLEFLAEGGTQEVSFRIEYGDGSIAAVRKSVDWLTATVDGDKVVITVSANPTEKARKTTVKLVYSNASELITISQEGAICDVNFEAARFEGIYLGTQESDVPNYFVILSDIGVAKDGSAKASGTYYYFDFYINQECEDEVVVLPNGVYTFDKDDTFAAGTFSDAGSWFCKVKADGSDNLKAASYQSATVTVTDDSFYAEIVFPDGAKHIVTYSGELIVDVGYINSTFFEDYTFDVKNAEITAKYFGLNAEAGQHQWFIEAVKGSDYFCIELFNDDATTCCGLYAEYNPDYAGDYNDKFIPGMLGENALIGTWYASLTNGVIKGDKLAPMMSGILRITETEGVTTIEYNCMDDAGNEMVGTVAGEMTIMNVNEQ